jgi:hypothetical protein
MNILDPSVRLIDALSGWGLRETVKYPGMEVPSDDSERTMLGMEVVLRHVPELIARLLLAEPLGVTEPCGVVEVDFGSEESDKLYLCNGMSVVTYTEWYGTDEHVRRLVETPDFRPLVCAVQVDEQDTGPIVVYDGFHRAAAWLIRAHEGTPYRLAAYLIKTRRTVAASAVLRLD